MSRTQFLMCLFGIAATIFVSTAEARARRLQAEGMLGGDDAKEGQFPYQISLEHLGSSMCGGSILSERFVITAAHCVINDDGLFMNYSLKVVAGINRLRSNPASRVAVDVVKVFVPEEYDPTVVANYERTTGDIAILMLNQDLDINGNSKLGKIKLPNINETYADKIAVISGFGVNEVDVVRDPKTGEMKEVNQKIFKNMRFANANVTSNDACKNHFRFYYPISKPHLCAALIQRNKNKPEGVCSGDSGGPLVYNGVQIAVVSTSPLGCREDSSPAVYTRLSEYLDFVDKVVSGKIDQTIKTNTLKISSFGK